MNNESREALFSLLAPLSDEQLNAQVTDSNWTIAQVVRHLGDLDDTFRSRILHALETPFEGEVPSFAFMRDRTNKRTSPIEPIDAWISKSDLFELVTAKREFFVSAIENVDQALQHTHAFIHPVFGPIPIASFPDLIANHEWRHVAQIEEMIKKLSE
ncbi:MAG: DinB family protein [Bacilli bacterium]